MRKLVIAAAALIAAISYLPSEAHAQAVAVVPNAPPGVIFWHTWIPWYAFGCPASIMFSAAVAANKDGRELTYWEAYTCGLLYWFGKPPKQYVRKIKHH